MRSSFFEMIMKELRKQAEYITEKAIKAVLPDEAVKRALDGREFGSRVLLVAIGKAAYQMAKTAREILGDRLDSGIVITKYGHVKGPIDGLECLEAGHPVPDGNSFQATERAVELVSDLSAEDTVIFLVSGGGSALFEKPLISGKEIQDITEQLLRSGASITEMNTIRKRLSGVKGGRFAELCSPAKVYSIVLSDIIGDPLDMIASGPAYPDSSICEEALEIAEKYELRLSDEARKCLHKETPKELHNVETVITGSVRELCSATASACEELGYETEILTDTLGCEAKDAGKWLAGIARGHRGTDRKLAFIAGGETVVHITGSGLGGRNQELALAAAEGIAGMKAAVFSVGSDGTDGPTDAAGGYVDGESAAEFFEKGIDVAQVLKDNDSYHTLEAVGGLIITGPTGTNVNDFACVLVEPEE